jgi:hypothetical protein
MTVGVVQQDNEDGSPVSVGTRETEVSAQSLEGTESFVFGRGSKLHQKEGTKMAEERRYYFAYGSNMAKERMASHCPGSQLAGRAQLLAHSFLINESGVATVAPAPDCITLGLLWTLTPADERALDRYEGIPGGLYRKKVVAVHPHDSSEAVQALIYVASNIRPGIPRPGYLEKIIPAACERGFPPEYVAELESWMPTRKRQR